MKNEDYPECNPQQQERNGLQLLQTLHAFSSPRYFLGHQELRIVTCPPAARGNFSRDFGATCGDNSGSFPISGMQLVVKSPVTFERHNLKVSSRLSRERRIPMRKIVIGLASFVIRSRQWKWSTRGIAG